MDYLLTEAQKKLKQQIRKITLNPDFELAKSASRAPLLAFCKNKRGAGTKSSSRQGGTEGARMPKLSQNLLALFCIALQ